MKQPMFLVFFLAPTQERFSHDTRRPYRRNNIIFLTERRAVAQRFQKNAFGALAEWPHCSSSCRTCTSLGARMACCNAKPNHIII